jgi:hypothetical protein
VALAYAGSFTHAAEQMFIAQPTLSQQIRCLEEIVGTQLLQRRWISRVSSMPGPRVPPPVLHRRWGFLKKDDAFRGIAQIYDTEISKPAQQHRA